MCIAAHGVKWLLTTAALSATLVAVHPVVGRADNPGHSLADRFATDEERARERAARAAKARRDAERARRDAEQLKLDEADMLARARAEAAARRAEQEQARIEAENADRAQREVEAQRAAEQVQRQAEAERLRRETEADDIRRRTDNERRRAAEAADHERRRLAEAERAAEEARRAAEVRQAEEDARLATDRAAAERLASQRAAEEQRARLAAEREAEARRITEALRQAEVQRAARGRQREPGREEAEVHPEQQPSLAEAPPVAAPPHARPEPFGQPHGFGAPVVAADAGRYTVLLLMEPGRRGIRRHNQTADPVLCGDQGCWVSNGPGSSARRMNPHKALGFFRTWGERAGACSNQLGCVFRGVELGALPGWLQPVDMRVFRHDRRQGSEISGASECWLEAQRLQCRGGYGGGSYVMWVVPEQVAEAAGPVLLEQALADGLAEPRQAALRTPWRP